MVLHCDWSTSISVLPVAPPPSCDSVSTLRLRENSKTSPAIHQLISICEWGTQLRVLTGKLQCEVTPPEDGNLEHRYRNISSCVGKSDQGKDKVVWQVEGQSRPVVRCPLVLSPVDPTVILLLVDRRSVKAVSVTEYPL